MANLFYYKHNARMSLNKSGFKVSQILTKKKTEWQFFDKNKQEWLLITSSVKAFDGLLSTFPYYYHA